MKQYNPNWPFPQFDEDGVQLLPTDFDVEPVSQDYPWDVEEALV